MLFGHKKNHYAFAIKIFVKEFKACLNFAQ